MSTTMTIAPKRSKAQRYYKPQLPEKDVYGLPVARVPAIFPTWVEWARHVTDGLPMPMPEPVTVERIMESIADTESQWDDRTAELAEFDAKLRRWDRWLADPRHRHDPRVGEAFQRSHEVVHAIQGTWSSIAERLGIILGCVAALPDPSKARYVERYMDRLDVARERAELSGRHLISPQLTFTTLPPALWAIARCEAVIAGCLTREATKPPLPHTAQMNDVAQRVITQIVEINRFNGYTTEGA